jgi:hypothetical protein
MHKKVSLKNVTNKGTIVTGDVTGSNVASPNSTVETKLDADDTFGQFCSLPSEEIATLVRYIGNLESHQCESDADTQQLREAATIIQEIVDKKEQKEAFSTALRKWGVYRKNLTENALKVITALAQLSSLGMFVMNLLTLL